MALFVATITGDFKDISGLFLLLATTYGCGWSSIRLSCSRATVLRLALPVLLSLVSLFFLFLSGLFLSLFGDL